MVDGDSFFDAGYGFGGGDVVLGVDLADVPQGAGGVGLEVGEMGQVCRTLLSDVASLHPLPGATNCIALHPAAVGIVYVGRSPG